MLHRELLLLGCGAEQTRCPSSSPGCSSNCTFCGSAVRLDDWSSDADYDQGCGANTEPGADAEHSRSKSVFADTGQCTAGCSYNAEQCA